MGLLRDLTGQKHNRLTVSKYIGRNKWEVVCECGNISRVRGDYIASGRTKSCGCLIREVAKKFHLRHGEIKTRIYKIWSGMRLRCRSNNPRLYQYYKGKGIKVCDEWNSYIEFKKWALANGYRDDLTIDRISGDLGYSPDNCRWATVYDQANNQSKTRFVVFNGEPIPRGAFARKFGLNYVSVQHFHRKGFTGEEILKLARLAEVPWR